MFENSDYPQPLDESLFNDWMEKGRLSKIQYSYLLIIWDEFNLKYQPIYAENREEFSEYQMYKQSVGQESLVAVYDLFSESRISLQYN